jgi:predicted PurR-regulated permease PerM
MGKRTEQFRKWFFLFSLILAGVIAYKMIDGLSGVFQVIGAFISVLVPFIVAGILAYLLYTPSRAIEEAFNNAKIKFLKKHRRGLSVLTVYFIVAIIIFIIINFVRPAITSSVVDLANNLPNYYKSAIDFLKNLPEDTFWSQINVTDMVKTIEEFNISEVIMEWVNLENIGSYVKGIVGAANIVFDLFVVIVVSVYILLERKDIKNFIKNFMHAICEEETYKKWVELYERTNNIFYKYISSQILDGFIVGILTGIVMNIMKIKYATLLGLMIGLFNIIPYFGAIAAIIISAIITIFTGGVGTALWMTLVVVIIQQIDANIINPRILGNSLNVSPILVIFATTLGGAYFGVPGMFLGVPCAALIKIFLLDYINRRNTLKNDEVNK